MYFTMIYNCLFVLEHDEAYDPSTGNIWQVVLTFRFHLIEGDEGRRQKKLNE